MSEGLSYILPNSHTTMRNHDECEKVIDEAIRKIREYFHCKNHIVSKKSIELFDDGTSDYGFFIDTLDMFITLHCGFWEGYKEYVYWEYFAGYYTDHTKYNEQRLIGFDLARIFGNTDAYICDEYHSWNRKEECDGNFEENWILYGNENNKIVHEFHPKDFVVKDPDCIPDYECKYHDSFEECYELLEYYQQKFPDYEILTLSKIGDYIIVSKDDYIYMLNPLTGKLLTEYPIDGCDKSLDNLGIIIYRGDESALFTNSGEQVTEFRVGNFSKKYVLKCDKYFVKDCVSGNYYSEEGILIKELKDYDEFDDGDDGDDGDDNDTGNNNTNDFINAILKCDVDSVREAIVDFGCPFGMMAFARLSQCLEYIFEDADNWRVDIAKEKGQAVKKANSRMMDLWNERTMMEAVRHELDKDFTKQSIWEATDSGNDILNFKFWDFEIDILKKEARQIDIDLFIAIQRFDVQKMEVLLKKGANPRATLKHSNININALDFVGSHADSWYYDTISKDYYNLFFHNEPISDINIFLPDLMTTAAFHRMYKLLKKYDYVSVDNDTGACLDDGLGS